MSSSSVHTPHRACCTRGRATVTAKSFGPTIQWHRQRRAEAEVLPARAHEGVWHGIRAEHGRHGSHGCGKAVRARDKQRVTTMCTLGDRAGHDGGALHDVCMCVSGWHVEANALRDRFTSHTCHTAHWGRSESTGSARDAKSEQSAANQVCNKPIVIVGAEHASSTRTCYRGEGGILVGRSR